MKRYDRVSTYFLTNFHIVIAMTITALLFNGLMAFIPILEGKTINSIASGDYQLVIHYVLIFSCLVLFVQINRFFKRYLVRVFANKITFKMRQISLDYLLRKDLAYFDRHHTGDILNKNLTDIYDTVEGIRKMTTEVFDTFILLLGYFISMFIIDYQITLVISLFIILSILASHLMKKIVYKATKSYKEYLSYNKELTITKINNELDYRGFGVSSDYAKNYYESTEVLRKKNMKALMFQSSMEPIYSSIALLGVFFITYMGGMKVINGVYLIGTLSSLLTTYLLVAKKAAKVAKLFNAYQGFKVSWVRAKDLLGEELIPPQSLVLRNQDLELENFSFSYDSGFKLPEINLKTQKGDIIAVCGRIHTGKSTILKALSGLYEYNGKALLGGVEVSEIVNFENGFITYSSSDVKMFSDTIANNISLRREGNLEKALETSCLSADLAQLGGLEAVMSHSVSNISGGQQRRLQMARALYPEPALILLDDPFQSVNKELVAKIALHMKDYNNSIIVYVTNNKVMLKEATKIIYLENNKAYINTYDELLQNVGFSELVGDK